MENLVLQLMPLIAVLGAAIIILLLISWWKRASGELLLIMAVAALCAVVMFSWNGLLSPFTVIDVGFPLMAAFDNLSYLSFIILAIASFLSLVASYNYVKERGQNFGAYIVLILFALFGGMIMSCGTNLIAIFIGLETLSLSAYALAGYNKDLASGEASIKYFVLGAAASAILLLGIAFYFGASGSFEISNIRLQVMNLQAEVTNKNIFLLSAALIITGFGFKTASVPFQWWAPDVYEGSPLPVTTFFATAVKAAAFVAFYRIVSSMIPVTGDTLMQAFYVIAVLTMTFGNVCAIYQDNVKRMLAYSSIAHAGYIMIAFVFMSRDMIAAKEAMLFYLLTYTVMTAGAFACLTMLKRKGVNHELTDISNLAALGKRSPWFAFAFSVFLLSLAGFPPTAGFFAKFYIFKSAIQNGFVNLAIIAVINSLISVYYYMRPVVVMYFGSDQLPRVSESTDEEFNYSTAGVIILCMILVLILGLFPNAVLSMIGM